jgi:hypothetical protein
MRFTLDTCPICGLPPDGTLETVQGFALLQPKSDGSPGFEYAGETKIWWDEQHTVRDAQNCVTLICEKGHDWKAAQLEEPTG